MSFVALPAIDVAAAVPLVAQPPPSPAPRDPGGRGGDFGKSSPVGFLVLILFFIAVAFLIRSMSKHLKRVPASFDEPEPTPAAPEAPARDAKPNEKSDSA